MSKKLVFATIVLLAAVFLSGCASGPVRGSTWPGLSADANAAYLANGPMVHAIDLKDGQEIWHYPESSNAKLVFYSTPVVTPNGQVIIGSSGNTTSLIALNPTDVNPDTKVPAEAWKFNDATDHWVAAPLVVNNKVFAVNADGNLYILDLDDGQSTKKAVKTIEIDGRLWAQPVTDGQRVFITSLDHSVVAVDVETYEVVWQEDLGGAIPGSAVIGADGMLYVGSLASQLEKFDPATGNHSPVLDTDYWIWSTPSVDGDSLYFGDLNGKVYSFNTVTGNLNWAPVQPDGPITASPIIQSEDILLVTESGSVYALDRDGKVLWSQAVGGKIYTTPVSAGGLTLVSPLEAEFYLTALDQNGRQVWTFSKQK